MTTETSTHPLITEAPDYRAWAGDGPNAQAILDSGDTGAMTEFRALVSGELHKRNGDVSAVVVEAIAHQVLIDAGRIDPDWATDETPMDLYDYDTGERIRRATPEEASLSILAAQSDTGAGVIEVDGRTCYAIYAE